MEDTRSDVGRVAAIEAPADSDPFCKRLVDTPELTRLSRALSGEDGDTAEAATEAAAALDALSPPEPLDPQVFTDAAAALRGYADPNASDEQVLTAAEALDRIGQEVQRLCNFPLG